MSLKIPSSFDLDLDLDISGIPTNYGIGITQLPTINIDLKPVEIKPINLNLSLKEIPSVRAHFPMDFKLGFALFGAELACIRLCGEAQAITEPFVPNPCEARG